MSKKPDNFKNTEIAKEKAKEVVSTVSTSSCKVFDEEQTFDIKEHMMFGILHGMKRSDIIEHSRQFAENLGVVNVTDTKLITLYNSSRDALFHYRMGTIEEEKKKFIERMYRLGAKAEAQNDFNNAFKAYDKIAVIAGVYAESDESKVILNFVPVTPSIQKADIILEADTQKNS